MALALATTIPLVLIAFTPLSGLWLEQVSGLPAGLARFAIAPLCIQAILPALTLIQALQRAVLLGARTTPISLATALETAAIFRLLFLLVRFSPFSGAVDAALALVCGRLIGLAPPRPAEPHGPARTPRQGRVGARPAAAKVRTLC